MHAQSTVPLCEAPSQRTEQEDRRKEQAEIPLHSRSGAQDCVEQILSVEDKPGIP